MKFPVIALNGGRMSRIAKIQLKDLSKMANQNNDFNPIVSLYTPASDPITAGGANDEIIFGRAGNDTFYSYDPGQDNNQNENVDYLFGDLLDNNAEEYQTFLAIQNRSNPLRILEPGQSLPTTGADKFVLGDVNQPYYTNSGSPDALKLGGTDFLGLNEYAVIYDFNSAQDTIQLNGKPSDYLLLNINGLKVQGVDQLFYGKALFSLQQGIPDLIAYVIEKPGVNLDLNDSYFQFVGNKPQKPSSPKKITQLGTTGIDRGLDTATDPSGKVYVTGTTSGPLEGTTKGGTDFWVAKYDNNGNQLWGKQFGTSGGENSYSVVTDQQGNFYLAGDTGGSLFGSRQSDNDVWVAKYDSNGNQLWGKQFAPNIPNSFSSSSFGLQVDQGGNVYLSGLTIKNNTRLDIYPFPAEDDSWVTKLDSNGNQQWFTRIVDPKAPFPLSLAPFFDETYDLAIDKNGNSYVSGWTQGLSKESNPGTDFLKYDAYISKVNPAGQVEWVQQFGSVDQGQEVAWAIDTDSQGNVYTSGWTSGNLGTKVGKSNTSQSRDVWIAKFSPDGTEVWAKQFGSPQDDGTYLSGMKIDSQDNIFITGYSNGNIGKGQADPAYNAFVAKFDTQGANKWVQEFGSKGHLDDLTGITVDNAGKVFVTGYTDGSLGSKEAGATDAFVAELDANKGNLKKFVGGSGAPISIIDPGPISTVDVSNKLVTDERLPSGDNRINLPGVLNYGQIASNLGDIFSLDSQNSFASVLSQGVANRNAPFLNNSDLNLLQPPNQLV